MREIPDMLVQGCSEANSKTNWERSQGECVDSGAPVIASANVLSDLLKLWICDLDLFVDKPLSHTSRCMFILPGKCKAPLKCYSYVVCCEARLFGEITTVYLAVQFNGIEKQQASSPSNDQHWQLRASGGGFRPIKHSSLELYELGDTVDPTIPLEKQTWYHGAISQTEAENLLRLCEECSYLVRNSQTNKHDYSLSLKNSQCFMHMKLVKSKEKYILGQNSPPFDNIPEVIHYYTTKKLPIKGAEHLSLFYPVAVQTL
ncbi:LOW QUALITY PROTEIN: SH2 domain-containing adapter protein B-like [Sarcoramphus papa]